MGLFAGLFKRKRNLKKVFAAGGTVKLGKYPQNGWIPTAVEWLVLDIIDGKALLITKYALIVSGYCKDDLHSFKELEWEGSLARAECGCFYHKCFSQTEKEAICKKKIVMNGFGADCLDYVFLLDENEVKHYFVTEKERKCMPSKNAKKAGAYLGWDEDAKEYTVWWILPECERFGTSTMHGCHEKYNGAIFPNAVIETGEIRFHDRNVYHSDFCIRPCVMVEIGRLQS